MANRVLQIRRGTKAQLPTLSLGEVGYCTDTKEVYIGNGVSNTLINPLILLNGSNGILVKTDSETFTNRVLQGQNGITVTDGDGINGNPVVEPDYGDTANTVCEGNDPRLLSTDENNFIEKLLGKYPDIGIEDLSEGSNHATILSSRSSDSFCAAYGFKNLVDSSPSTNSAIYGTVLDSHAAYEFGVKLSGNLDTHHFDLEWVTYIEEGDIQIGVEDFADASDEVSVTFGTAFANTNYSIVYSIMFQM